MNRPGRLIGVCAGLCLLVVPTLRLMSRAEVPRESDAWLSAPDDPNLSDNDLAVPAIPEANTVTTRPSDPDAGGEGTDSPEEAPPESATPRPFAAPLIAANRESEDANSPGANVARRPSTPAPSRGPTTVVPPDPNAETSGTGTTRELVGFVVRGRSIVERLQVDDLDSIVTADGKRLLPLLRILHVFAVHIEEKANMLRFTPEGLGEEELDLDKKQLTIRGQTSPIEILEAVSEITMKPDFYVAPEDLGKILDVELEWDSGMYEYRIQLARKVSLWKFGSGRSLLSIQTKYVEGDLPEALPAADRSRAPLQLVELDWHPNYTWQRTAADSSGKPSDSHTVNLAGPRETVWGSEGDGQYKVQVSQPNLLWTNNRGWHWENDQAYLAQVDWFEWVQRFQNAEVTVGDSTFGFTDLVYPVFTATGVRVNGLLGWMPDELLSDRSQMGLQQYFGKPQIFQGTAPIGSQAELILNGRTIDVQKVFPQADSPPGMGVYRFEGVELPNGILNEVTIVIKEPDGNEIRVDKSVLGTPQLVPEGHAAYVGIAGTKREMRLTDKEVVDPGEFYGYVMGGRVLYGVTDRLTVGTVLAGEDSQFHRLLENQDLASTTRPFPDTSQHAGGTFSYLPLDNLMFTGDVAASQGQGEDRYNDIAARLRTEYLPTQQLSLNTDLLNLGSHYFDGSDPDVSDRRGGEVGASWRLL